MKVDNSYCQTHDVYGKSVCAEVGDDMIVNYYLHNGGMIVATYNRRTTVTTEEKVAVPSSLL